MARIEYHIEGTAVQPGGYHGELEIDEADLPADADERAKVLEGYVSAVLDALSVAVRGARDAATSVGRGEHTPPLPGQPDGAYVVIDLATKPSAVGEHDKFLDAARQALIDCRVPYAWCSSDRVSWHRGPNFGGNK